MLHIGCHLTTTKGLAAMGRQALALGGDTLQFFTRNPRGAKAKAIDHQDAANLMSLLENHHFVPIIAHAPYIMNLCADTEEKREFAQSILADDLVRMTHFPNQLYNFHPGSHVGQGVEAGIDYIAEALNQTLTPETSVTVLLETMAGKGTEIGGRFEELRAIIDRVDLNEKMGVCLDTCHVWDGGYDLVDNLDGVLAEFDAIIGLERLKAIHLNDSLNPNCSHKDRHACIGAGHIGLEAMERIVNHPALKNLPFCLETPNDLDGYAKEIGVLRDLTEGNL
ncbi:deoxyribonuclease IV [Bengtsoniella intestinalis]|uniref:deoxyribonuclease IV n=1 Tax=Bengtsoniella intestinalis TaxID=3073143 RepID=UPI00391F95A4